jgi:hypothetical protein
MGLTKSVVVQGTPDLSGLLEALAKAGLPGRLMMVDNQLVSPDGPPPVAWRDARLTTPAGMIALKRDGTTLSITVFGNADAALLAAVETMARLLSTA